MNKTKNPNIGLLHRLRCAFYDSYPFKGDDKVENTYRNGTYGSYYKEKLYDLQEYSKNIKKQPIIHSIASYFTIGSFLIAFIFYFTEPFKNNNESNKLIIPLIIISFGLFLLYSFTILIIWNDKKNYSSYYEQLIEKNINALNETIEGKNNQIHELKDIIDLDIRSLFDILRKLNFYTFTLPDSEKVNNLFKDYLNILCHITSKLNFEFIEEIGSQNIDKYSACIKIISKDSIINDVEFKQLTLETISRSDIPNHYLYENRLKIMEKYDDKRDYISLNKDFSDLVNHKNLWNFYIYDLDNMLESDDFYLSHPESHKFYQSGVALPIVFRTKEVKGILIGFLCFQNYGKNAFPSIINNEKSNKKMNRVWEEFCHSQADYISLILSQFLDIKANDKVNKLLLRKRFRSTEISNLN